MNTSEQSPHQDIDTQMDEFPVQDSSLNLTPRNLLKLVKYIGFGVIALSLVASVGYGLYIFSMNRTSPTTVNATPQATGANTLASPSAQAVRPSNLPPEYDVVGDSINELQVYTTRANEERSRYSYPVLDFNVRF